MQSSGLRAAESWDWTCHGYQVRRREKDGHTLARNTQWYNRHSRYPETWPEEIFSLDLGNLIDVVLL